MNTYMFFVNKVDYFLNQHQKLTWKKIWKAYILLCINYCENYHEINLTQTQKAKVCINTQQTFFYWPDKKLV